MKQKMNLAQFSLYVVWLGLIVLACFAAARAQTGQPVTPLLDEIIVNPASGRATAYFGYTNSSSSAVTLNIGEPANFFFPSPQNRGQLSRFIPGTHRYAFAVVWVYADEPQITWILNGTSVVADTATVTPQEPTTVFTYQGRLADNNAAASGAFDLEFKLFNAGGIQIGPAQVKDNVPVTSGIFTVQLEAAVFGSNAFNGGDRTLEIGVRRGTETGAFTPLTPRQPITSAPYAIRSLNSATADTAANALTLGNVAANQYLTGQVVRSVNGLNNNVTLAAGANVTITPSGSTLTIASTGAGGSGAFSWEEITGASVQAQSNRGYIANNNAAQVVVTLPASPGVGDVVRISGAGSPGWRIAQNAGQFIVLGTFTEDFPAVWTPRETVRDWKSVASSADGTKLVAVDRAPGPIYTSTNSGINWIPRESARDWQSVASSADGTKLVAVAGGGGRIYTSTDSGMNWIPREDARFWESVASSADGTKLVAVVGGGRIYTSTDSGLSWTPRESTRNWEAVASSADGTKLVAVVYGAFIYTSIDSGLNWTPRESNRQWVSVTSSSDGTKLAATFMNGQIYTSSDSGVIWTPRENFRNWRSIASSADGTKLAAVVGGGQIYTSADSGVSWIARESARNWQSVASSSDGTKLVAGGDGGQIYTAAMVTLTSVTTTGASGILTGGQNTAVELLYTGGGRFMTLSSKGTITAF